MEDKELFDIIRPTSYVPIKDLPSQRGTPITKEEMEELEKFKEELSKQMGLKK